MTLTLSLDGKCTRRSGVVNGDVRELEILKYNRSCVYVKLYFSLLSMVPDFDELRKTNCTIYGKMCMILPMCTIFSFVYYI